MNIILWLPLVLLVTGQMAMGESYRYQTDGEKIAENIFGSMRPEGRALRLDLGGYRANVEARVDCGNVDLNVDISAWYKNLLDQSEGFFRLWRDRETLVKTAGLLAVSRAFPKVYAYLTHNSLRLEDKLGLKFDMCKTIDNYLDSQGEKGRKQLKAEAQLRCVKDKVSKGVSMAIAVEKCQGKSGLPLVDFQNWASGSTTSATQDALRALVAFSRRHSSEGGYKRIASILGEIEVTSGGYFVPVFSEKILYPDGVVTESMSIAQECKLRDSIEQAAKPEDPIKAAVWKVTRKHVLRAHMDYLSIMSEADRRLACNMLGRSIGTAAAEEFGVELKATMAVAMQHPKIPEELKNEYRQRTEDTLESIFLAARKEKALSVPEALTLISAHGRVIQEKSELIGRKTSSGKITKEVLNKDVSKCVDESTCH